MNIELIEDLIKIGTINSIHAQFQFLEQFYYFIKSSSLRCKYDFLTTYWNNLIKNYVHT